MNNISFGKKIGMREFYQGDTRFASTLIDLSAITDPLTELFPIGASCDLQGVSKGKGRAGVVKKWGFAGGPRTHGQSDRLRRAGSIGQGTTPGRVYKGKHMSGRMGSAHVTIKNSLILALDETKKILTVKGSVPGHTGSLIRLTVKKA
ncbi:50S ribosomal protein L3 [Candidatus Collierbacteria bacterium RIFOXYA1_FULL_46_24]|nr:MAG: 50S ribosomal protein L3 [Candidatus Collierbacteria bacterium RIFOXYA1_FULL_46_24]